MRYPRIFSEVFSLEVAIASAVFVLVLAAVLFSVVHRRAREGIAPSPRSKHNALELGYLALLAATAVFLVVFTALANHREVRAEPAAMRVRVTAFQWCWSFDYPEQRAATTADCRRGRLPALVVPTGRAVRLELRSDDVIHSLWVPALRYKMDVFPHHTNTFTLRLDRPGQWIGRCAEFCGYLHYRMDFRLRAVSPEDFGRWLQSHHAPGASGTAL